MADYISGNSTSRAPLILGIVAVGIVIVLGLVAFGGGGGDSAGMAPGADPAVISEPAPATGGTAAPVFE